MTVKKIQDSAGIQHDIQALYDGDGNTITTTYLDKTAATAQTLAGAVSMNTAINPSITSIRNITAGTDSPTGGSNGDVYIQTSSSTTHPLLSQVYPVGACYISTSSSANPGSLFGGTWTAGGTFHSIKKQQYNKGTIAVASTNGTAVTIALPSDYQESLGVSVVRAWPGSGQNWNNGAVVSIANDGTLYVSSGSLPTAGNNATIYLTTTNAQNYVVVLELTYISKTYYVYYRTA